MDRNYAIRRWLFDDIVNFPLPLFRLSISSTFFRVALHLYDQTKVYDRRLYYVAKDPRDTIVSTTNKRDNLSIVDRSKKKKKRKKIDAFTCRQYHRSSSSSLDLFSLWLKRDNHWIYCEFSKEKRKKKNHEIYRGE